MSAPRLSVVVVSWGRARALVRCLTAMGQMRSTRFEVIVVADAVGREAVAAHPLAARLTVLAQEEPNISAARNAGIAAAAGEVIGFIDDDAVPEPGWAEALLSALAEPDVAAVTGPVLGRNGISVQWGHMAVDRLGMDRWIAPGEAPGAGEALKLHGTNMAVRRDELSLIGLFDTGFRFYLDETDLALRLAQAGAVMRYVPGAVVHHGFAASSRRNADRVPLDLTDIGASTALFLRKHAPGDVDAALERLMAEQRGRLLRLARRRRLDPPAMRALMESLSAGIADGRVRDSAVPPLSPPPVRRFVPVRDEMPPAMAQRDGWLHQASRLRKAAAEDVAAERPSALMLLEPTPRKHRVEFTDGGWWEQYGGLYGPSDRAGARFRFWRYRGRVAAEWARLFGD